MGLEIDNYKNELHDAVEDAELSGCGSRHNACLGFLYSLEIVFGKMPTLKWMKSVST